jgi:hypothetical protein
MKIGRVLKGVIAAGLPIAPGTRAMGACAARAAGACGARATGVAARAAAAPVAAAR